MPKGKRQSKLEELLARLLVLVSLMVKATHASKTSKNGIIALATVPMVGLFLALTVGLVMLTIAFCCKRNPVTHNESSSLLRSGSLAFEPDIPSVDGLDTESEETSKAQAIETNSP